MAGLVPAIYVFACGKEDVDAREKPGHDSAFVKGPVKTPQNRDA